MLSWPLIRYVLIAAVRDRLVLSLLLLMIVGASIAIFLGSAAVSESDQFAVVFAAGGLRLTGAVGLILFIVFYLRRSFESRDIDFLLSRPVSRVSFLLSHAAAFTILAAVVALFVSVTVCAIAPHSIGPGYGLWAFSLLAEYIMVVNTALFFAMVLPNAAAGTLAVFALYLLARLIGQILGIIHAGIPQGGSHILAVIMQVISLIVPRFDLMAQTSWLIYGPGSGDVSYPFIVAQGVIFSALVIMGALVDLVRRQF